MQSWKQCAFLVITTMVLWHSCTWAHDVRLLIADMNEQSVLNKLSKEHNESGHK